MGMYFSDIFEVDEQILSEYGAFNISLVNDLPLFIDPFLLFNSTNERYKKLHEGIIKYLIFLRDNVSGRSVIERGMLDAWFRFPEVKQAWLGYCTTGNSGSGLGNDFAVVLSNSLKDIFSSFGNEQITKSSHLEKICLIKKGVGKDCISDFTANLIKYFLAEYTQQFAQEHLDEKYCKIIMVDKTLFNYETKTWESREYFLPVFNGDYVLLTPTNILRYEDTWINRKELITKFEYILPVISNDALRFELNEYFYSFLSKDPKKPSTESEKNNAAEQTILTYPQVMDYYIKNKEENGDDVIAVSAYETKTINDIFIKQVQELIRIVSPMFYTMPQSTYVDAMNRVLYLKQVIENNDGYRIFYHDGMPIKREIDLHIMYRLVCYGEIFDVNSEVNNGRGPVDYKISNGNRDKTLVEFKLASNKSLKRNLQNQVEIYAKANQTDNKIKAILYFSQNELEKIDEILKDLKINGQPNIILIDARKDNKPSASIA